MDRRALGAADVSDEQLVAIVGLLLGEPVRDVGEVHVEPVDYDLEAITTLARWWVDGTAPRPWRMFVKHVQAWERHPYFRFVPEEHRAFAAAGVPWRSEPEVYRSDLPERLPEGLSMPRALHVTYLDELSAAVWLEEVPVRPAVWDLARHERAAYLLGRLAASPAVAPLGTLGHPGWGLSHYASGRLALQVLPMLAGDELWRHPLCAAFDADLVARLRAAGERAGDLAAEVDALPYVTSHGDACPNNLMASADPDGFVLLDFGFWGATPVGFDLGQLLVGDVQLGRRSADTLAEVDAAIVPAYVAGLRAEGSAITEEQVRRGHALQLLLMSGLSSPPFDLFDQQADGPPSAQQTRVARDRATLARYALGLAGL